MRILELRLATRDLRAQREFYSGTLGLRVVEDAPDCFAVQVGTTKLIFEGQQGAAGAYHLACNIPENKLAEAKRWLGGRASPLTRDGEDEFYSQDWNAHNLYFLDPAGNILELIARHDLGNAALGEFSERDLLNVSEIGWPVADVPAAVSRLQEKLGLSVFKEQSETFTPLGDDEGLLIVVPLGRPWFPTAMGATVAPLEVVIAGARAGEYVEPGLPYRVEARTQDRQTSNG